MIRKTTVAHEKVVTRIVRFGCTLPARFNEDGQLEIEMPTIPLDIDVPLVHPDWWEAARARGINPSAIDKAEAAFFDSLMDDQVLDYLREYMMP